MRIAAATYTPKRHADWDALTAKLTGWVADAAGQGAELLVFPEYAGIEAALVGETPEDTPQNWRDRMVATEGRWRDLHETLARRFGVHILAGSGCAAGADGPVNRAWLCGPAGSLAQDKLIPTPYERDRMGLTGGTGLALADTALGRIGILICYDAEFPLLARASVAAGADILLVPSCTDLPAGQTRVRQSARARAIEGQLPVVQAPLSGAVPGCDIVDVSTGRAGLFVPPDHGMPPDGIVAQGETDVPGWTLATLDLAAFARVRTTGQVGNAAHWPEQEPRARVIATARI